MRTKNLSVNQIINLNLNNHYKSFFNNQQRYAILYGGAGSGKSYAAAQKLILRCIEKKEKILVMRKVASTLPQSCYSLLKSIIEDLSLHKFIHSTKSPLYFKFFNGSEIIFSGVDNREKLKSISNITSIWIEEVSEIDVEDFLQINLRLRDKTVSYHQIILTFNPISADHWLYDYFFNTKDQNILNDLYINHSTYLNNPYIDINYKQVLNSIKDVDENYYNIYCLGQWGQLAPVIYPIFQSYSSLLNQDKIQETFYGIDFGYNNPSCLLKIDVIDQCYYITECIYQSNLTRNNFFNMFESYIKNKKSYIFCDSAEPASIQELLDRGYNARSAIKSVNDGINYIKSIHNRIYSRSQNLNFNKENSLYTYKTLNNKIIDEPLKINDHAMDALRYALYTYQSITKTSKIKSMSIR